MKQKEKKENIIRYIRKPIIVNLLASLLENLLTVKGTFKAGEGTIRAANVQLELARIFDAASSFNKFWNTKVLSKWT